MSGGLFIPSISPCLRAPPNGTKGKVSTFQNFPIESFYFYAALCGFSGGRAWKGMLPLTFGVKDD